MRSLVGWRLILSPGIEWTGNRWLITLDKKKGQKTFIESQEIKKSESINNEKESKTYKELKNIFSDIELLEVKEKE